MHHPASSAGLSPLTAGLVALAGAGVVIPVVWLISISGEESFGDTPLLAVAVMVAGWVAMGYLVADDRILIAIGLGGAILVG